MENQTTYTCPNCGATITNSRNCEYCGSLLVRFAAQNIQLNIDKYGKEGFSFPGLESELRKNLALQRQSQEFICTDIDDETGSTNLQVARAGTNCHEAGKTGLEIYLRFSKNDDMDMAYWNAFKHLDIYNLFTYNDYSDYPGHDDFMEYYINFGEDYSGAARLISTIVTEVYFKDPSTTSLSFNTWTQEWDVDPPTTSKNGIIVFAVIMNVLMVLFLIYIFLI